MKKLTTVLTLLCLTFGAYSQNTPSNVPTSGLTGWWPFNGNANDLSGNGNNGTVSGATLTNDRNSSSNSAYYFDGTNDFVNLGSNSLLPKTAITISIWFKTNHGSDQELFSSDQSWSTYTCRLSSNGTPQWRIYPQTSGGTGLRDLRPTGTNYSDNKWHHFVGTWSGTQMVLYIDGVSVASGSMTTTPVAFNSGNALIGKFPSGVNHFKGDLDDIGIWSRALSSQEILGLYNRCTASVSLSQDTVKSCGVDSLQLDAGTGWKSYVWSNNDTSQQTYVSNSGMYHVTVTDTNGCIGKDSVYVSLIKAQITQVDTAICKGDTLEVGNLQTNQHSLSFSSGKYVRIPMSSSLSNFNKFTLEFWYYQTGFGGGDERIVGTEYYTGSGYAVHNAHGDWASDISDGSSTSLLDYNNSADNTPPIVINKWHHFAVTYDGVKARYFLNGTMLKQETKSLSGIADTTRDLVINRHTWASGSSSRLTGQLDELRISNIARYTSNFTPPKYEFQSDSNTAGLWHFNEGTGSKVIDASSNNNHGTIVGTSWSSNMPFTNYPSLATSNYSYQWSTNDTTSSIMVSPSQTSHYYVTTSDGVGSCKDSITIAVSEPIVNATIVNTASCANSTDGSLTASVSNGITPYTYKWSNGDSLPSSSGIGVGTYNVTVTDSIGCIALDTISMTYNDSVKPTANIQNLTLYLDTNGTSLITTAQVNDSSFDNCGLDTMYLNNYSFNCSDTGSNTVILTVKDVNGNSSSANATITVLDTISPTAISQNRTLYLDANGAASVTAVLVNDSSYDNCTLDTLYLDDYSFNCSDTGSNTVILTVKDVNGNSSTSSSTITVLDTISPTAIAQNLTLYLDTNGAASITTIQVNDSSYDNCTLDTLYLDDYNFNCSDTGSNTVILTVKDVNGNTSTSNATITVLDTISPTAISQNFTVYLDANGAASITTVQVNDSSFDNCTLDTLYLDDYSFNCSDTGSNIVILTVKDVNGNASTSNATITVLDTISPTAITQNLTVYLDANGAASITPSLVNDSSYDNCTLDTLYLDKYNFNCSDTGSNAVILTVKDVNGNTSTSNATITVLDTISPTAIAQNLTVYLDANGAVSITTVQVNDSSYDNCTLDTLYLDDYNFNCSDTGSNSVVLTVKDVNGNTSSSNATITVLDTISPTAIAQNLTLYLDANGAVSITTTEVNNSSYDNCTIDTLYLNDYSFSCSDTGSNTVILTIKDLSGNTSTSTATITVLDTISPTAIAQNLTVYLDANGIASITPAQVNNGSSDNCQVGLTLSQSIISCEDEGDIMLALIASDSSGNTSIDSFSVQVIDTNFTVASIKGDMVSGQGNINTYSVSSINGATYQWSAVNGISVASGSSSDITWSKDSIQGEVQVIQTVKEGCKDTSSMLVTLWVTGIKDIQLIENINLFPNPTHGRVFISVDRGEINNATILVYSGLGQLVISHKDVHINASAFELDLEQLPRGQYTVVISSGERSNQYRVILH